MIRGVLDFSVIDWPLHQSRRDGTADMANHRRDRAGFGASLLRRCRVALEVGESALVTIALWDYSE